MLLYSVFTTVKKLFSIAVIVLSLAFLASLGLSVAFSAGLDQIWSVSASREQEGRSVAVLLPQEMDPFWDDLVARLAVAGVESGLRFEVSRYSPHGENVKEVFEKASLSKVDGLVCLPPDSVDLTGAVDAAEARGVPVLLLEHDVPDSRRRVFLGTGGFQLGYTMGRLIARQSQELRRGGVLLSQSDVERQTIQNSLFLNGLNEGLGPRSGEVSLQEVISPPGRFAGEELVWGLLRQTPPVQLLVTTNSKDTISALQTIVEANRVGKTALVGVGEIPELRTALDQGLILGLVTRDPAEWAKIIATTLGKVFSGQELSSYVSLPIHALVSESSRGH